MWLRGAGGRLRTQFGGQAGDPVGTVARRQPRRRVAASGQLRCPCACHPGTAMSPETTGTQSPFLQLSPNSTRVSHPVFSVSPPERGSLDHLFSFAQHGEKAQRKPLLACKRGSLRVSLSLCSAQGSYLGKGAYHAGAFPKDRRRTSPSPPAHPILCWSAREAPLLARTPFPTATDLEEG